MYLQIYDGTYYLTNAGWQSGVGYYIIPAVTLGSGIKKKISFDIPAQFNYGYDTSFTLRFRIYEFYNENPPATNYFYMDNLRIEVGMDLPETRLYTYENTLTINNNLEEEIALGDSWITDFLASATVEDAYWVNTYSTTPDLTSAWSIRGDATASAPIAELLARQKVEGFARSIDELSGTLRSTYIPFGTFGIKDSNLTDEMGFTKHFFPTNVSLNARRNECNGTWVECPVTYTDENIQWASSDYDTYTIDPANNNIIVVENSAGDGTATSDIYVSTVTYETVRVVIILTDEGSSDIPHCSIGGVGKTLVFGTNYLEVQLSTTGNKTIVLGGDDPGDNHNYEATISFYSLAGV
jgi:hypothetical protein